MLSCKKVVTKGWCKESKCFEPLKKLRERLVALGDRYLHRSVSIINRGRLLMNHVH